MRVEFFTAALGGPDTYAGRSMNDVHRGRGVEQHHVDLVAQHLTDALLAVGVPTDTIDTVIGAIAPLSADIVSSSAT
jgi:hemoglobin